MYLYNTYKYSMRTTTIMYTRVDRIYTLYGHYQLCREVTYCQVSTWEPVLQSTFPKINEIITKLFVTPERPFLMSFETYGERLVVTSGSFSRNDDFNASVKLENQLSNFVEFYV